MGRTATVDGFRIGEDAVRFELERLVRFYADHGMTAEEVRAHLPALEEKALEQAIGARLLLAQAARLDIAVSAAEIDAEVSKIVNQVGGPENYRKALAAQGASEDSFRAELAKGVRVNKLVEQACAGVAEPTDEEVAAFYEACKASYGSATLVDVHDQIKDLLRHEARGKAMDAYVAELREKADIRYSGPEDGQHAHGCGCGCGH